jgi:hypothetical protein
MPGGFNPGTWRDYGVIMAALWRVYPDLKPSPGYFINYISCPVESHLYCRKIRNGSEQKHGDKRPDRSGIIIPTVRG